MASEEESVSSEEYREKTVPQSQNRCALHNREYSSYCETCEEMSCEDCTISGPHNNREHWLMSLEEAYDNRISKLRYLLMNAAQNKRDFSEREIAKMKGLVREVHESRQEIEQEAREYFVGMTDRLDRKFRVKMAVLNVQCEALSKDLEDIDRLKKLVEEQAKPGRSKVELMRLIPIHRENISYIMTKPLDKEIKEAPYDLPRELFDLRQELERMGEYDMLIAFKDRIIVEMSLESMGKTQATRKVVEIEGRDEIGEWTKLADKLSQRLSELALVCHFCAEALSEVTVNETCMVNRAGNVALKMTFKGFTDESPDFEDFGSSFHYFGRPKREILDNPHLMNIMNNHIYKPPTSLNPYKEALMHESQMILNTMRREIERTKVDLRPEFEEHDTHGLRVVNRVTMNYILHEKLGLLEKQVSSVVNLLDPFKRDLINYDEFINLLETPGALSSLPFFFYADRSVCDGYEDYLHKFEDFRLAEEDRLRREAKEMDKEALTREKRLLEIEKKMKAEEDKKGKTSDTQSNPRKSSGPVGRVNVQMSRR